MAQRKPDPVAVYVRYWLVYRTYEKAQQYAESLEPLDRATTAMSRMTHRQRVETVERVEQFIKVQQRLREEALANERRDDVRPA